MNEKYIVMDEPANGYSGDCWPEIYDTAESANDAATMQWLHLTKREQQRRHIFAGLVKRSDLPEDTFDEDSGKIDWAAADNIWDFPGAFDSDKWSGGAD